MKRIELHKYVVTDGSKSLDYDSHSGGYPWAKGSPIGHIFDDETKAALALINEANGSYVTLPRAGVYRIVLEYVDTDEIIAEAVRIETEAKALSPEVIAYIKKNM